MTNSKKKRIVQVIKGFDFGGLHGGADLFGVNLSLALKKIYPNSDLCVFFKIGTDSEAQLISELNANGVDIYFLTEWMGNTSFSTYWFCLQQLIKNLRNNPTWILHSHFHIGTLFTILMKILRLTDYTVRTAHVDQEWKRGWDGFFKKVIIRLMIFFIFPLAVDLEAGVSTRTVQVLNQRVIAKLTHKMAIRIFNSIHFDHSLCYDVDKKWNENRITFPPKIIGTVGRLSEQKGYIYLLQAIPSVLDRFPDLEFWIIGDGELKDYLVKLSRSLGISNKVKFWGRRDDVRDLLRKMDLFVSTSTYEGLPTVVLESMAQGVPVIATSVPGTLDIIQHGRNGWCIPPGRPDLLADQITYVIQNPEIIQSVVRVAFESLDQFSIENSANSYFEAYMKFNTQS